MIIFLLLKAATLLASEDFGEGIALYDGGWMALMIARWVVSLS